LKIEREILEEKEKYWSSLAAVIEDRKRQVGV